MKSPVRKGVEISVLLDGVLVFSRWHPMPSDIAAGDGPGFPVFFPWRSWEDFEAAQKAGYELHPVRGVHAAGATFLKPSGGGRVSLILPAGVHAVVNGRELPVCERVTRMDLEFPFSGEIRGAAGWTLRFSGESAAAARFLPDFRPGFMAQSLLFGVLALGGLLFAAFNAPPPPFWEEWEAPVRSRLAMIQWTAPQKRIEPPAPEEETIRERLVQLRTARPVRARVPQPRVQRAQLQLKTMASRNIFKLPHEDHVIDLSDPDAPPGEEPEPVLDLDSSSVVETPVVAPPAAVAPVAPLPMAAPPMTAPEKPREATPARRVSFPRVDYPESARHLGIEGKVRLLLHIDEQGRVTGVEVLSGLHPLLDQAAVAAAKSAVYEPARDSRGNPIASTVTITIRFELEEE